MAERILMFRKRYGGYSPSLMKTRRLYPVGAYLGAMLSEGGGQVPAVIIIRFMISPRSARLITGGEHPFMVGSGLIV